MIKSVYFQTESTWSVGLPVVLKCHANNLSLFFFLLLLYNV